MSQIQIRVRDHGPLLVEGSFTLLDADGQPFALAADKPAVALCRCGHSAKRPFCDGTHKTCGFVANERASG